MLPYLLERLNYGRLTLSGILMKCWLSKSDMSFVLPLLHLDFLILSPATWVQVLNLFFFFHLPAFPPCMTPITRLFMHALILFPQLLSPLQVASFSLSFRWVHVNKMGWLSPEVVQAVWIAALTAVYPSGTIRWTYRQAVWHTQRDTLQFITLYHFVLHLTSRVITQLHFFLSFLTLFISNYFLKNPYTHHYL